MTATAATGSSRTGPNTGSIRGAAIFSSEKLSNEVYQYETID